MQNDVSFQELATATKELVHADRDFELVLKNARDLADTREARLRLKAAWERVHKLMERLP